MYVGRIVVCLTRPIYIRKLLYSNSLFSFLSFFTFINYLNLDDTQNIWDIKNKTQKNPYLSTL